MSGNGRPAPWQPSTGDCRYGLDFTSDHLDTASSAGPPHPSPWRLSAKRFGGGCTMLKKTVSYESYWRLATQGEGKVGASSRSGIFKVGLSAFVQPLIEMLMIKCNQRAFLVACLWLCAISTIVKADECDWEPVFSLIYEYDSLGKQWALSRQKAPLKHAFLKQHNLRARVRVQACLGQKSTNWQGSRSSLFHSHLPGKYLFSQATESFFAATAAEWLSVQTSTKIHSAA